MLERWHDDCAAARSAAVLKAVLDLEMPRSLLDVMPVWPLETSGGAMGDGCLIEAMLASDHLDGSEMLVDEVVWVAAQVSVLRCRSGAAVRS